MTAGFLVNKYVEGEAVLFTAVPLLRGGCSTRYRMTVTFLAWLQVIRGPCGNEETMDTRSDENIYKQDMSKKDYYP